MTRVDLFIFLFFSCDYNKYTISVIKKIASLQLKELKVEVKSENEAMDVDENNVISI